jgi:hypothetical protein
MSALIWWSKCPRDTYEYKWIHHLFPNVDEQVLQTSLPIANAIHVVQNLREVAPFLETLYVKTHTPFYLVHISDEFLDDDYVMYASPMCKHVFRNYIHPGLANMPHVTHFAIGYKSTTECLDNTAKARSISERQFAWSFSGYSKKSDRELLLQMWQMTQPFSVHRTNGFGQGLLHDDDYAKQLLDSQFVLCPIGNCSMDTFRLYEALECGCIPITIKRAVKMRWNQRLATDPLLTLTHRYNLTRTPGISPGKQ